MFTTQVWAVWKMPWLWATDANHCNNWLWTQHCTVSSQQSASISLV